jgi:hypothetical protein
MNEAMNELREAMSMHEFHFPPFHALLRSAAGLLV